MRFPAGASYTQGGAIVVAGRSDLTIDGNDSTFKSTAPNDDTPRPNWRIDSGTRVTMRNMRVVGNFAGGARGIKQGNQFNHGVLVRGGTDVTIRDVKIREVYGDGVATARSGWIPTNVLLGAVPRNVRMEILTVTTAARQCVAFTEIIGGWLQDSTLRDCHYGAVDMEIDVGGQVLHDLHILRNDIANYYLFGIAVEGSTMAGSVSALGDMDDIEIRGNTLGESDTCWEPILFSEQSVQRGPISDITVADNTLATQGDGIGVYDVVRGSVTGNTITLTKPVNGWCESPALPVRVERSSSVTVGANTINGY